MRVKLLCSRAGLGSAQNLGDEIDVADDEGARMVAAGQAEIIGVKTKTKTETATKKVTTEKAVKN